jgi:dihydroxyacetone kinase-like protein
MAARTADRTRSIGVALSPCLIPGASEPGFGVPDGMIEIGMGIHGEPGLEKRSLPSADDVATTMVERLLADGMPADAKRVAVLVNSLGATPLEELLIVYRKAEPLLRAAGLDIAMRHVGHYATSMEMAGCSMSLVYLDAEIEALLAAPTRCPFWPR